VGGVGGEFDIAERVRSSTAVVSLTSTRKCTIV